ncbi:MAG: hypothetical protein ACI9EF_002255, partial [Pseudohongiellaceae bacterium]
MNTRRVTTLCSLALIGVLFFDDDVESSSSYAGGTQGHIGDGAVMNSDGSADGEEMDLATALAWLEAEGYAEDSSDSTDNSGWGDDGSGWSNDQAGSDVGGDWFDSSLPAVTYDQNEYANPESSLYDPYEVDSEGHVGGAYENPESCYYSP